MTFEQIDAAINKLDLASHQNTVAKLSANAAGNPALALPQLCPIYKGGVRAILVLLSNFPLIPQKWRDAIKALISVLDLLCP
ncbi:MAG TPA: hypothetical protein VFF39_09335 [Verrucomicrobiae bacterium]|nr:hypothetical protein [Verrucomicrobiae bacterium]